MENFEEQLIKMSKPEFTQIRHQHLLVIEIEKAKNKLVVHWWWILIPLYLLATLLMKSYYMPSTTFISNLHEIKSHDKMFANIIFLLIPIIFILLNILNIWKLYRLAFPLDFYSVAKLIWINITIIFISLTILILNFI